MKKIAFVIVLCLGVLAVIKGYTMVFSSEHGPAFRTAPVERKMLIAVVAATGVLQPEDVIDVGAQVAGRVERFGPDPRFQTLPRSVRGVLPQKTCDYGTPVTPGTVLCQLDPSLFQAAVAQNQANLSLAHATLIQLQAKMEQAKYDMERAQSMLQNKSLAKADYDSFVAAYLTAQSNIKVGEAFIEQAEAALKTAQINLGYSTITSPVNGVIIDRRVNVGQTVVSSLSAPSLFLIAKDLKRMQVWAQVNEADIGMIKVGQLARFTVEAFPNDVFKGEVFQIRLNANNTQNVTTYTVVVNTDNSNLRLLPYMTANVQFVVGELKNTLQVANAALRWSPQVQQVVPEQRQEFTILKNKKVDPTRPTPMTDNFKGEQFTLWVTDGQLVRFIKVRIGLSDGTMTQIVDGDLKENMEVVVREDRQVGGGGAGGANPFTPQMFGKKKE
jgi:HlyD family secretion protein